MLAKKKRRNRERKAQMRGEGGQGRPTSGKSEKQDIKSQPK